MTVAESWIELGIAIGKLRRKMRDEAIGDKRGEKRAMCKLAVKLKEQGFDVKWICGLTGLSEVDLKTPI